MKHIKTYESLKAPYDKYITQEIHNTNSDIAFIIYEILETIDEKHLLLKKKYRIHKNGKILPLLSGTAFTFNIGDIDIEYQSNDIEELLNTLTVITSQNKFNL